MRRWCLETFDSSRRPATKNGLGPTLTVIQNRLTASHCSTEHHLRQIRGAVLRCNLQGYCCPWRGGCGVFGPCHSAGDVQYMQLLRTVWQVDAENWSMRAGYIQPPTDLPELNPSLNFHEPVTFSLPLTFSLPSTPFKA